MNCDFRQLALRHVPKQALASAALFILAAWFINPICFYLSPVALAVVLGYSYTKRFTPLCHLVLGLGLSLAPIGAYLAVTGVFNLIPLLFSGAVLFWVAERRRVGATSINTGVVPSAADIASQAAASTSPVAGPTDVTTVTYTVLIPVSHSRSS